MDREDGKGEPDHKESPHFWRMKKDDRDRYGKRLEDDLKEVMEGDLRVLIRSVCEV